MSRAWPFLTPHASRSSGESIVTASGESKPSPTSEKYSWPPWTDCIVRSNGEVSSVPESTAEPRAGVSTKSGPSASVGTPEVTAAPGRLRRTVSGAAMSKSAKPLMRSTTR